jgi:hypothetical protein
MTFKKNSSTNESETILFIKCNTKEIKIFNFYKKVFRFIKRERHVKIKGGQMAIQFCIFQETLFRKVVVTDEYYYQLK